MTADFPPPGDYATEPDPAWVRELLDSPDPAWELPPGPDPVSDTSPAPGPDFFPGPPARSLNSVEIHRKRYLLGYICLMVAGVLLLGGLIWGNYALTLHIARTTALQAERLRAQALSRQQDAVRRAAVPECRALHTLSQIQGQPVTSYGVHLQEGFRRVYRHSGCPAILREYGKPIRKARSVS